MGSSILEELYTQYFDQLYRFFYYKTISHEAAEELTSSVFLDFANATAAKTKVENPQAYLFGIAKHKFYQYLQQKYHSLNLSDLPEDFLEHTAEVVKDYSHSSKLIDMVAELTPKLPESQAKVIQLRLVEKLNLSEIAEQLHKDMNYVKVTQRRAIKTLQKLLPVHYQVQK